MSSGDRGEARTSVRGDGRVDARRPARPPPVPHVRHRPPVRPRERRRADRRHRRLRDVGHARRRAAATPCCCATPGPATATSPGPPAAATRARAGGRAWSGPGRPIDTDRWFVVCANVLGGCQGIDRPGVAAPGRRPAVRLAVPGITIRDMVRAQARLADHLGHRPLARRHRRLDGRDAGARVGDHVPAAGALDRARSPRACRRRRSRSRGARSAAGRSRSTRAGAAATTTTPSPATGRPRAWRSPAWSPR